MALGHLVFPVVVGIAILLVSGYVVSTPATPAPEDPQQRLIRAEVGDQLLIEVTAYYAAPDGNVFFSTQEERHESLRRGALLPQLQESPVSYTIGESSGLDQALLGKRQGDKFTTPVIPPAPRNNGGYGVWEAEQTVTRTVATLPIRVDFTRDTTVQAGRNFNATEYASYFEDQGHTLREGLVWPCEDPGTEEGADYHLWECRLVKLDLPNDAVSYDRVIQDGTSYPLEAVLQVETVNDTAWNFTVHKTSDGRSFDLRLDPPVGTIFQIKQDLREPYHAGTYEIRSATADTLRVRYSPEPEANPLLIGQPIQYDIEILRILRA